MASVPAEMQARLTQRADRDLVDIHRHTSATFGVAQADRYLTDLGRVFELIAAFPEIGRSYDGRTRQFVHGPHIILYRVDGDGVVIGRVFHAAQRR